MIANCRNFRSIAYAFLGFACLLSASCALSAKAGSGVSASETRKLEPFDSVRLEGAADVDITIAEDIEVVVTTDDNLLSQVVTINDGKTLVIRTEGQFNSKTGVRVAIKMPHLTAVTLRGVGRISIDKLKEPALDVDISGAGSVSAKGSVDELNLKLSGTGSAKLDELAAKDATVALSGTGSAKVNSAATLDINLSGVGSVNYKGGAKVTQHVSGVGSVSKM